MKQHSIYCSAFRHFFKNLENMLRLRQVQFIHRSVSPYKISRISCVNIFTMGKRTLAIRHTLEKNLFHKFCLTGLEIKHLFPYCSLRTEKEPLWLRYIYWKNADTSSHSKSWRGWKFFFILCVQNQRMTTDCEKKRHFYNQTSDTKLRLCDLSRRVQVGYEASKFIGGKRFQKCGLTFTI